MSIGEPTTAHATKHAPYRRALPAMSPRRPTRAATAVVSSIAGISAKADTDALSATSDGLPPSATMRSGRKVKLAMIPMYTSRSTARTPRRRGWTRSATAIEPPRVRPSASSARFARGTSGVSRAAAASATAMKAHRANAGPYPARS